MKATPSQWLTVAAVVVIVALTGAAFWLSYAHLHTVAAEHGLGGSEVRAWAWPATLDLFIVAGELLMLRSSLARSTDWWAVGLTVAGSGGSIALNIAGVTGTDPLDYVTAAVPPTAALLAFGALMRQVHGALSSTEPWAADPHSVGESTTQVGEFATDDTQAASKVDVINLAPDQAFSRSRENAQAADQAFSVTAEEGASRGGSATDAAAQRDSLSLTEVPEGPEFVGSSGDRTNPVGHYRGGTPSSSVGPSDATLSVRPADGKGVQGPHPLDGADLRGAAELTTPGVSAAVDAPADPVHPEPVPGGYTAAPERVHLSFLPLPDRRGTAVAQTETTAADDGRTRTVAHAEYASDSTVPGGYTDPEQDERDDLAEIARSRFAGVLAAGLVPSIRTLRAEYGIGQARAQRVQDALRRVPAAV